MRNPLATRTLLLVVPFVPLVMGACGGGGGGSSSGAGDGELSLTSVSNGFGALLPHSVALLGADGRPTSTVASITRMDTLVANVTRTNPVRPPARFPGGATLPSGAPGNHYLHARFSSAIAVESVLDPAAANGSTGALVAGVLDRPSGGRVPLAARVFVGGWTVAQSPTGPRLERWIEPNASDGTVRVLDARASGFPGTPGFLVTNAAELALPESIVVVADDDGDLSTPDAFPTGHEVQLVIGTGVRGANGGALSHRALASTTVGADAFGPEIVRSPPPFSIPAIVPGNGQTNVDPTMPLRVLFDEPVQPLTVGDFPRPLAASVAGAFELSFGPPSQLASMPYVALPESVLDLSSYVVTPAYAFPGSGPMQGGAACGAYNEVAVDVRPQRVLDLSDNANTLGAQTTFSTGEGPGIVNAPIAPAAIYVARAGATPALSVIDLDGFGQGTGDPRWDPSDPQEGDTNFPNDPNYVLQPNALFPPLVRGLCTVDGGSSGVFTLTRDSSLDTRLARAPSVRSISDAMLGHALDSTFDDGTTGTGCQSGGGNLCASGGFKQLSAVRNGNTLMPSIMAGTGSAQPIVTLAGAENPISWAPHPNPPMLAFPPTCIAPPIGAKEPTSVDVAGVVNLLVPGDALGDPLNGRAPSGLLTREQNAWFQGPSRPSSTPQSCRPFAIRQQIGQFLYVVDRDRRELVVMSSNRMTVLDRIELPDPTTLAMSPNVNLIAVTNQTASSVTFVDVDPSSSTFHQVVQETSVGARPRGIAWDPSNEDVLVACEGANEVDVISAATLQVRHTVSASLSGPFDVAITERQVCWGFNRNVYFAWILNRDGHVALFESGPATINGWGYDDVIGAAPFTFQRPKAIQPDPTDLRSAVWIAHEGALTFGGGMGPIGEGAVSKLAIVSGLNGMLPLNGSFTPHLRDLALGVQASVGASELSGIPVDLAFDDLRNFGAMQTFSNPFSAGAPTPINGKSLVRGTCPNVFPTSFPSFLFVAVPSSLGGSGVVDVLNLGQGAVRADVNAWHAGRQSIPVESASLVVDYFRQ